MGGCCRFCALAIARRLNSRHVRTHTPPHAHRRMRTCTHTHAHAHARTLEAVLLSMAAAVYFALCVMTKLEWSCWFRLSWTGAVGSKHRIACTCYALPAAPHGQGRFESITQNNTNLKGTAACSQPTPSLCHNLSRSRDMHMHRVSSPRSGCRSGTSRHACHVDRAKILVLHKSGRV